MKHPSIIDEKFQERMKSYCQFVLKDNPWGFTNPKLNDCVYFENGQLHLNIRSNFKLQRWMVGDELFVKSNIVKSHLNYCVSEKYGGETVIIDINGYGEINDLVSRCSVPEEIKFYVQIRDILKIKLMSFEKIVLDGALYLKEVILERK